MLETQAAAAAGRIRQLEADKQELERHAAALNSGWLASLEECSGLQED